MEDIVILGAGGLAREVAFLIDEINRRRSVWRILGFAELDPTRVGTAVGSHLICCSEDEVVQTRVSAAIAIGSPAAIRRVAERFHDCVNVTFPNLVHPGTVWHEDRISMGRGNIVQAGSIFTTDIHVGSFNYFNLSCTYGHDVEIGDYCVFNPGANVSGGVKIGSGCLIGTGAKILQNVTVGDCATVGAGAVVVKDVPENVVVVGVPAKILEIAINHRSA